MRAASLLLGATAAMAVTGLVGRFQSALAPTAASPEILTHMVVAAALLMLALGVSLPQRVLVWVCTLAWRRFARGGGASPISAVLLDAEEVDRPLYWVGLSVVALAAGVLTALLPRSVGWALDAYAWMLDHFLWSNAPLAMLQMGIVFLAAAIPLTVLGLAVSCMHHLSCLYGRWEIKGTAWLLIGAAMALGASHAILSGPARGDLALAVAAIPALLTSIVSATARSARPAWPQAGEQTDVPLPIWSDRWPKLLRASIVALACIGVGTLTVWTRCWRAEGERGMMHLAVMLLALGLGALAGSRSTPLGRRPIGTFGVVCALTSVAVALSTLGTGGAPEVRLTVRPLLACLSLGLVGFATASGWQTLLSRAARRSVAGATVLSRMLACGGLTIWVVVPLADRLVGPQAVLMLLSLCLAVVAGTMILQDLRTSTPMVLPAAHSPCRGAGSVADQ